MTALLETRQLSKTFDGVVAARDITLAFEPGQTVAVIGTNGAGKTTFVNMVTGFTQPTEGVILFEGQVVNGMNPRDVMRAGICRSFQVAQLFPTVPIGEQLRLAIALGRTEGRRLLTPLQTSVPAQELDEVLEAFDLHAHREQPANRLPQGLRKIADIAMAVAGRPRLLFLDEPTSGVSTQEKGPLMTRVMRGLTARKVTTVIIEHDMEIVAAHASRVIAFHQGAVLADGPPGEVLVQPEVLRLIVGD